MYRKESLNIASLFPRWLDDDHRDFFLKETLACLSRARSHLSFTTKIKQNEPQNPSVDLFIDL